MTRLSGAHVLVTGGSEGIGLATARRCLERGARVSIIARGKDKLAAASAALGPGATTASADVTDPVALDGAVADLVRMNGDCDVVVAAAGGAEPGYLTAMGADVFRRQMELNYFGALHAVRSVLPGMVARRRGHVVLLSSLAGLLGVFGYGAYAPAKFALRGLGQTLDAELRRDGIRVSVVYPPDTETPGFERENRAKPPETVRISAAVRPVPADQVAAAIVRGIERDRLTITADRQTAVIARLADVHGPAVRAVMRRMLRD